MSRTDSERTYHSPLREAQASQTRTLILETMAQMLADGRADNFSVKALAQQAGVSERTVYRYFPDREALLDGLGGYLNDRMGTATRETDLADLDQMVEFLPVVFGGFDANAEIVKASVLLNPDPGRPTPTQRRRSQMMIDLTRATFPDLDDADAIRLGRIVRTLTSTHNWLRMREEFGLDGEEIGQLLGWVLRSVIDQVRRTGQVGPTPEA